MRSARGGITAIAIGLHAVALLWLVPACLSLSLISGGDGDAAGATADGGDADAPSGTDALVGDADLTSAPPTFLGSRLTLGSGSTIKAGTVAGVMDGDLLVAGWMGPSPVFAPVDWSELGRGEASASGAVKHKFWVGFHVVRAPETDGTTYSFTCDPAFCNGGPLAVAVIAYRGVRAAQPVSPAVAQPMVPNCSNADAGYTTRPAAIDTRGRSAGVYVIGSNFETPAMMPGLKLVETTSGLAIYRTPSPLPDGTTVPVPDFGGSFCPDRWFSASLGIVGAP